MYNGDRVEIYVFQHLQNFYQEPLFNFFIIQSVPQ